MIIKEIKGLVGSGKSKEVINEIKLLNVKNTFIIYREHNYENITELMTLNMGFETPTEKDIINFIKETSKVIEIKNVIIDVPMFKIYRNLINKLDNMGIEKLIYTSQLSAKNI